MASGIPAKLKAAAPDVQRFAARAAQLEKYRPIVTYWCEYYILQQVLTRQFHTTDEECTQYALQLMDKLEVYKSENAANDAVIDDVAAKAYIENFALETFSRADEAQRGNKVTKQTADTFQASATFMDLLSIWGPLEQEIQAKAKFAKFHALRIAKAIKAGEDPNASNPVIEQPPAPEMDDDLEAELKKLETDTGVYRPPTVESAPESGQPSRPPSTIQSSILPTAPVEHEVSPIEPAENTNPRSSSVGGGYFPAVPHAPSISAVGPVDQPHSASSTFATTDPADFYSQAQSQPPAAPSPATLGIGSPNRPSAPTPNQMIAPPIVPSPVMPAMTPPVHAPQFRQAPPQPAPIVNTVPPAGGYRTADDSIMAAQKHAKWAISALNFEDVQTAVEELKIALNSLGAS